MLASGAADDIAYVMDDGLTSLSGTLVYDYATTTEDLFPSATDKWLYVTFIGTGISFYDEVDEVWEPLAQNLPYGTHIMSFKRHSSIESSPIYIDGVQIKTEWFRFKEFAFHQPKKPPIPEDAVVLADYMLMADFVPQATAGIQYLSKGTRMCSISRMFLLMKLMGILGHLGKMWLMKLGGGYILQELPIVILHSNYECQPLPRIIL